MEKKINLKEILSKYIDTMDDYVGSDAPTQNVIDAMLDFGGQLLELAAENAYVKDWYMDDKLVGKAVDKQSILDTLNQVG